MKITTKKALFLALTAFTLTGVCSSFANSDIAAVKKLVRGRISGKDISIVVKSSPTDICGAAVPNYIATVYVSKLGREINEDGQLVIQSHKEVVKKFSIEPGEVSDKDADLLLLESGQCW